MALSYNPTVNDRSGEILGNAMAQAGAIRGQGMANSGANLAQGISQAGQFLSSGTAQAGQIFAQNQAKTASNLGKMEALAQYGLLAPEQLDTLAKMKDPDKLAGALAVVEQQITMQQRAQQQQQALAQEYQLRSALAQAKEAGDRTGQTTTIVDPVTGTKHGAYFQNRGQVSILADPQATPTAAVKRVDLGGGMFAFVDAHGRAIPKSAVNTPAPGVQQQQAALAGDVAKLQGEVDRRGPDAKNGPNWWPFTETLGTQLAAKQAQLNAIGGGAAAPAPAPAAATPPTITTQAQYDALPSGSTYVGGDGKRYRKP